MQIAIIIAILLMRRRVRKDPRYLKPHR